ncbi:MAG: tetratricopeptide repeat protein [Deltaproteobacteria bacterium]|nr:tetratricopeptide repeat protein [Deltaproteobacteria bacterium]
MHVRVLLALALIGGCSTSKPAPQPTTPVEQGPAPLDELDKAHRADAAGDLAGARTHLETAIKWAPNLGIAHVDLADVLMRSGDEGPALAAAIDSGKRLEPTNPRLWRIAGMYAEDQGDAANAISAYETALRFQPGDLKSRFRLAGLYAGAGKVNESISAYQAVLAQDAADRRARLSLADELIKARDLSGAEAQLTLLTQQDPKNALYQQKLQALLVQEGKVAPEKNNRNLRPLRKSKR